MFEETKSINFNPPGFIPNDFINDFSAEKLDDDFYAVTINVNSGHLRLAKTKKRVMQNLFSEFDGLRIA
nr:DUF6258 family protein [Leptospira santarosai]